MLSIVSVVSASARSNFAYSPFYFSQVDELAGKLTKASITPPKRQPTPPKTELCHFYAKGECTKGDACQYIHAKAVDGSVSPLKAAFGGKAQPASMQICRFNAKGTCTKGSRCKFIHEDDNPVLAALLRMLGEFTEARSNGDSPKKVVSAMMS